MASLRFKMEPLRELDHASIIGGVYIGVGTAIDHAARQIIVTNLTNAVLAYSFNGADDHFVLAPNGYWLNDITSNKVGQDGFFLAKGDRLYVTQVGIPTSGSTYFSVIYADE